MSPRAPAVTIGGLVILGVLGCGAPVPEAPLRPVMRLADARYQRPDDPSMAAVPVAIVGDERRPVLANVPAASLKIEAFGAPVPGRLTLRVPVPPELRGKPLRLSSLPAGLDILDQQPRMVREAAAEEAVDIVARDRAEKERWVLVSARSEPPEPIYLSDAVSLPPAARLRFGIGVEDVDWPRDLPPVTFTVSLVDPGAWWRPTRRPQLLFRARLDPAADPAERRWFDHEVDLGKYAGRRVRLEFTALPERRAPDPPFVFPVWSDPTIVAPDPAARPRRNLVLLSLDTLRADHLGCYGYGRPTSPTIDGLAAQGTLFERAYSSFPSTTGSHMTILTGLYPCAHGLGLGTKRTLDPDVHTLAELARAAGYGTAAFTENGGIGLGHGFGRGFGTYVENLANKGESTHPPGERTFADARGWIGRHAKDPPWFVFIHTYQAHIPLAPPPGYRERVAPDPGGDQRAEVVALYDGEIRYADDLVARLLGGLEGAGVADETLIVLLSDHGEHFGEHGIYGHQNSLYDELLHVPLILHAPGLLPAGTRVTAPVGLVDVLPTVLDLLGLPPLAQAQGRSLVPLLRGADLPEVPLFAELPKPRNQVAVRRGRFKWILHRDTGKLEELPDAPPPEIDQEARTAGAALVAQYQSFCRDSAAPAASAPIENFDPIAVQQKLRALGYVQ